LEEAVKAVGSQVENCGFTFAINPGQGRDHSFDGERLAESGKTPMISI
jgi:hypothetical protein